MGFRLSVNTNPFVNRFAEPEDLIATLHRDEDALKTCILRDVFGDGEIHLIEQGLRALKLFAPRRDVTEIDRDVSLGFWAFSQLGCVFKKLCCALVIAA